MKKYLFLFTISPVQSFIAQARKTQDLYAGSRLLSDLIRFAIQQFDDLTNNYSDVLFPANSNNKDAALPNRFLAELEIDDNETKMLGRKLENAVQEEFKDIAKDIFEKCVKNENDRNKIKKQFFWQIENHLIIHWLFEPLENQTYEQSYKNIESNLGAIKNLRRFKQLPEYETGRKDSLTGELNALIFNKGGKPNAFTEKAIEISEQPVYLSIGEGLSAVSFIKRFYNPENNPENIESFPSTAEIAQYDIKEEIEKAKSFNTYKALFNGNFDYQLLYKDNLNAKYFEKQGLIDFKTNDKTFKEFLKDILDEVKAKNKKQKKYYAILAFDGDDMGKWLSGEKLIEPDEETLKKYHKRFSELLGNYAQYAKSYVDDNNLGRTIYAGGDDFLALLNLDKIFDIIIELRQEFEKQVSKKLKAGVNIKESENLTFSAGLVIAHYKAPLGEVLNRTRSMEHKAKENTGKNSVGIAVMKHSGEMSEMILKWGEKQENIQNLSKILGYLQEKTFSPAFIENLNREFNVFREKEENINIYKPIETEINRLVKRSYILKRRDDETKEYFTKRKQKEISELTDCVINLYIESSVKNLLDTLNIIDFIYRKA